jgi:hypothetical protein
MSCPKTRPELNPVGWRKWMLTAGLLFLALTLAGYSYLAFYATTIQAKGAISIRITETPKYQPGQEITESRTRTSKTHYLGGNKYSLDASIGSIHYQDEAGSWQDIDPTIVTSDRPNWDYEVVKGHWTLLIADDTTVAIGKDGHWIGMRYEGVGYLDVATKDYVILDNRRNITPIVTGNKITWPGIFYETELVLTYQNDRFKEDINISQAARDWLSDNPPSSYGLSNQTSYLVIYVEMDWKNTYPAEDEQGLPIDWAQAHEIQLIRVLFRNPAVNKIVSALPVDYATHPQVSPQDWIPIRKRFWQQGDTNYLLFGGRVADLNQYPSGTITFDPTVDVQVGADADDGFRYGSSFNNNASYIDMGYGGSPPQRDAFFRWTGVSIEGTIDTANVSLYSNVQAGAPTLIIYGVDEDNPDAPTDATEYGADPLTTASVAWDGLFDDEAWNDSPDIKTIIQELVDSYTISSDAVMLQIKDTKGVATHINEVRSHDFNPSLAGRLHIEYTVGGASPDISNTPASYAFGIMIPGDNLSTGLSYYTVTNNGSGAPINISITSTNMTDLTESAQWVIADDGSPDVNIYGLLVGLNGGSYNTTVNGSQVPFIWSLADSASQGWGFQILYASETTHGANISANITLDASLS